MNFSSNTTRVIFTAILVALLGAGASLWPDAQKLQTLCGYPEWSPYFRLGTYLYKMELMKDDPVWENDVNVKKVRLPDGSIDLSAMKAHILSKGILTPEEFDIAIQQLGDAGLKMANVTRFKANQVGAWAQVIEECRLYRVQMATPAVVATST